MKPKHPTLLTYEDVSLSTGIKVGALRKRLCVGSMPKPDIRVSGSPAWYPETLAAWLTTAEPGRRSSTFKPRNRSK